MFTLPCHITIYDGGANILNYTDMKHIMFKKNVNPALKYKNKN